MLTNINIYKKLMNYVKVIREKQTQMHAGIKEGEKGEKEKRMCFFISLPGR